MTVTPTFTLCGEAVPPEEGVLRGCCLLDRSLASPCPRRCSSCPRFWDPSAPESLLSPCGPRSALYTRPTKMSISLVTLATTCFKHLQHLNILSKGRCPALNGRPHSLQHVRTSRDIGRAVGPRIPEVPSIAMHRWGAASRGRISGWPFSGGDARSLSTSLLALLRRSVLALLRREAPLVSAVRLGARASGCASLMPAMLQP